MIKLRDSYKNALYNKYYIFWIENGPDKKYGGIYTCLDQKGEIYNTDKSVWLQGRALRLFSKLYNSFEKKDEWLEAAEKIYQFVIAHRFDRDGRMFFSVTEDGKPLQKEGICSVKRLRQLGLQNTLKQPETSKYY